MSGVPPGFVGRFEQEAQSLEEYASTITRAIEAHSREVFTERLGKLERRRRQSLTEEAFLQNFVRKGVPMVISGFTSEWDPEIWSSVEKIAECYGDDTPWTCRKGPDYASMETLETTLPQYLRQCELQPRAPAPGEEPRWYGANNWLPPWMAPHLGLPPGPPHVYRATDTRLWIGPPGSGVPLHRDLQA